MPDKIKIPCVIKPLPIGKITEYDFEFEEGQRLFDLLPEVNREDHIFLHNKAMVLFNQNPVLYKGDEIEILVSLKGGGGNKDTLRTVAFLSVALASGYGGALIAAEYGTLAGVSASLAMNVAGSFLINQLIPVQLPETTTPDSLTGVQTKSLEASENKPNPYSTFPKLYGGYRIKPVYASSPITEIIGDDQYLHFFYFLNFGPVAVNSALGGLPQIAGKYYNGSSYLSNLVYASHTSPTLANGTIKIDDTNIEVLDDWAVKIGNVKDLEASNIPIKDLEITNLNIDFKSSIFTVSEAFRISKRSGGVKEKILELSADQSTNTFKFEFVADSNHHGTGRFRVQYEKASEYNSGNWISILPSAIYQLQPQYDNIGYDKTVWGEPKKQVTYYSRIIHTEESFRRIRFTEATGSGGQTFKTVSFFDNDFAVTTTAPNTYAASIDLAALNGLYYVDNNSKRKRLEIDYSVEYRPINTTDWTTVKADRVISGDADNTSKELSISGNSADTSRAGFYFEFPSVGQYDIRITPERQTAYSGYANDSVIWERLKSYQSRGSSVWAPFLDSLPVPTDHPQYEDLKERCTLMYLKVKAVPTLQGNANNISIYATGLTRDLDFYVDDYYSDCPHSVSNSNSPANIYADILLGHSVVSTISQERINFNDLIDWHTFCNTYGFEYNNYESTEETIIQRLNKVCAVGLAKFGFRDEKFSVLRDIPDLTPVQVISPVNTNSFSASKQFNPIVQGVKVQYVNTTTWETDYVIVYNTGYNLDGSGGDTAASEFLTLEVDGITDLTHAKRYGRYHLANITLRPETFNVNMDIESLRLERGDTCFISYDTIKVGETVGRVKTINKNGSNQVTSVIVDEAVTDVQAGKGISFRYALNGSAFATTYPVDEAQTTEFEIFLETPTVIGSLNERDIFVYGDIDAIKLKAKVTEISPDNNMGADITLVNAAEEIHETYTSDTIPSYVPVIDSRVETGLNVPPKPTITSVTLAENYVYTSDAVAEPYSIKVDFTIPYTVGGVNQIILDFLAQGYEHSVYLPDIYETGVFEQNQTAKSGHKVYSYDGSQNFILFPAKASVDYEIRLYTGRSTNGINRVSQPAISTFNFVSESAPPAPVSFTYEKFVGDKINFNWPDTNTNYPVIYRIFVQNSITGNLEELGGTSEFTFDSQKRFSTDTYAIATVNLQNGLMSELVYVTVNEPYPVVGSVVATNTDGKIQLTWDKSNPEIVEYEVREGTVWESATLVERTNGSSVLINKTIPAIYNFMVRGIVIDGGETESVVINYNYPFGLVGETPSQPPGIDWKENLEITVGSGGDFTNLNDAIAYFSGVFPGYKNSGVEIKIRLLSGFIMQETIVVKGVDLGYIEIVSDDAVVMVNKSSIPVSPESGTASVFIGTHSARLPTFNTVFQSDGTGANNCNGLTVIDSSHCLMSPGSGFNNFYICAEIWENATLVAPECEFRNSLSAGLIARQNSNANVRDSNFSDDSITWVGGGVFAKTGSTVFARNASANNKNLGFSANDRSSISADFANANNCSAGIQALKLSSISAQLAFCTNCNNIGIIAETLSTVVADSADTSGTPTGFEVYRGSFLTAYGGIGTLSQTANVYNANGVIFQ